MKKIIDKIDSIKLKDYQFQLSYIALAIISLIYVAKTSINIDNDYTTIMIIILFIVEIIMYFLLKRMLKKNVAIHNIYLLLIIVLGSFYIIGFPPSQLPDDSADYYRSLEVSELHLISIKKGIKVGRNLSKNIYKVYESKNYNDYLKNSNKYLTKKKEFTNFANKALYAFICYIPQATGVGIGRILHLPIVYQAILGKIFNFALFVCLTYLSIKYIPTKKNLLFLVCMLPITIQEATSLSADCMTIATSLALFSLVLWAKMTKTVFQKKHYISLGLLLISLSLCKIVYIPLCFLILLIPQECFKNQKKKIIYCISILIIIIALNLIWLKISSSFLEAFKLSRQSNSSEQLKFILSNPIQYLIILFNTIDSNIYGYLDQIAGHSLGAFTVSTSYVFVVITLCLIFNLIKEENIKSKSLLTNTELLFTTLIFIGTSILIFTSLYIQWTPVKATIIEGAQGRYFIPIIPLICLPFIKNKKQKESINTVSLVTIVLFNLISIVTILSTYM